MSIKRQKLNKWIKQTRRKFIENELEMMEIDSVCFTTSNFLSTNRDLEAKTIDSLSIPIIADFIPWMNDLKIVNLEIPKPVMFPVKHEIPHKETSRISRFLHVPIIMQEFDISNTATANLSLLDLDNEPQKTLFPLQNSTRDSQSRQLETHFLDLPVFLNDLKLKEIDCDLDTFDIDYKTVKLPWRNLSLKNHTENQLDVPKLDYNISSKFKLYSRAKLLKALNVHLIKSDTRHLDWNATNALQNITKSQDFVYNINYNSTEQATVGSPSNTYAETELTENTRIEILGSKNIAMYEQASPLDQFLILRQIPTTVTVPKFQVHKEIENEFKPSLFAHDTCKSLDPVDEHTYVASHIFMSMKEEVKLLESFKVKLVEREFPSNTVFLNGFTCVIVVDIYLILDSDFIRTLYYHAEKVKTLHILFVIEPMKPIRRYSFTPPLLNAMSDITRLSIDSLKKGTRIHVGYANNALEIAYWIRTWGDLCINHGLPKNPRTDWVEFFSQFPMFNPYSAEIIVGLHGIDFVNWSIPRLIDELSPFIPKDRLVKQA